MRELSASDVSRLLRKARELSRANAHLKVDLHAARQILMRAMVRREGDAELIRGRWSRRAAQYALLLICTLEESAGRKAAYYESLQTDSQSLTGLSMDSAHARVCERAVRTRDARLRLVRWRSPRPRLAQRLQAFASRVADTLTRPISRLLVPQGEQWMRRALEVGEAFATLSAEGAGTAWELEAVRQAIIRDAGRRYDPQMVEALIAAWQDVLTFHQFRRAA